MPEPTIQIVNRLLTQLERFKKLAMAFGPDLQTTDSGFSLSLSYSTWKFTISQSDAVYFQYTIQHWAGVTEIGCYFHDKQKIDGLKEQFSALKVDSVSDVASFSLDPATQRYLSIAESIAACAYNCTRGDDYWPGYFSEIIVSEGGIELTQNNQMNSRSLAHKQDYSLRNLEFYIPLNSSGLRKPGFEDELIGVMRIHFSDRSSLNNQSCGDRIRARIDEEKSKFA